MANSTTHAALPYPIINARFTLQVPYLDADGDPTDPTTPDTEISKDAGAFADCAEEVTTISGSNGMGYLTLTGAETNCAMLALCAKVASGPKNTLGELYPRVLAIVGSGTLSAGSAGGGTLGTILAYDVCGCFIRTTGGTGGGGTGGANNQARKIITYTVSTGAFTVSPNWETTPDNTTTYDVLLPEGVTLGMLKTLNPATAGRTLVVDAAGLADSNVVKVGPSGSGTAQTAGDLKALIDAVDNFIDTEIADIQSRLPAALGANGNMKADVRDYNGTAGTFASGRPEVKIGNVAHGGSSARLQLGGGDGSNPSLYIHNSLWEAVRILSTADETSAVEIASQGAAATGVYINATNAGIGVYTEGGSASVIHQDEVLATNAGNQINLGTGQITAGVIANGAIDAATFAADVDAEARGWVGLASANLDTQLGDLPTNAELTTALGTADDAVLAAIAALNNLSQANIRTAVGLGSANLDTQLSGLSTKLDTIDDFLDTEVAAILAAVDTEIASIVTAVGTTLPAQISGLLTGALTESYRSDGATGSVAQMLYEIVAHLGESSISSTTKTTKKIDGSTTAASYTLNSATTPTSITRAA